MSNILEIKDLYVDSADGEKEILKGVNLLVGADETHVLMGPNGTGKSTLGYAITGNPGYEVKAGKIIFDGEDITELPVNERAKKGIFLSFQNPLEVPGISLSAFLRNATRELTGQPVKLLAFQKKGFFYVVSVCNDVSRDILDKLAGSGVPLVIGDDPKDIADLFQAVTDTIDSGAGNIDSLDDESLNRQYTDLKNKTSKYEEDV